MSRATRLTDAIYLPQPGRDFICSRAPLIILISVCNSPLVHCLGLWFRTRQAPVRAGEWQSRSVLGTTCSLDRLRLRRIYVCKRGQARSEFSHRAGCVFHLILLTGLHLTTRGPQRFNRRCGLRRMAASMKRALAGTPRRRVEPRAHWTGESANLIFAKRAAIQLRRC